ncbi:MAG: nicotinate-nucleotide--dimethylbenzimidazole phosphoribosyltransferase [Pseudomonadota bacterium]
MSDFLISSIHDAALAAKLDALIADKTKPPGSLGMLEALAKQIGLIQQSTSPGLIQPAIAVFAGDHGIVAEGISAYPQSVTWQMVENFLAGGAAINVFARQSGCALHVVDAGVNHVFGKRAGLIDRKIASGTHNFAKQPAMTPEQCEEAMRHGSEFVASLSGNVLGFGEMGIGNTTAAAALMHLLTGEPLEHCVGAGAGLPPEGVIHKQRVIGNAVRLHKVADNPFAILATFGGFEIAMMAGAMLAAAQRRMTLLIDGFIVTSALLVAAKIQRTILQYCVFAHRSDENGHRRMLQHLDAQPLLALGLRLGEGTGCALALPLLQAATEFLNQMATFDSAQVSGSQ